MTPAKAYALLAVVVLLWGASWPVMKVGLAHITPLWFGAVRVMLGAAVLLLALAAARRLRLPRRRDLPIVASVGGLQVALMLALINTALQHVEAGRSAILVYATPLWVTPLSVALLGERLTSGRLAALLLGLAGMALLFSPWTFAWSAGPHLLGNGLLVLASMAWAVTIVHLRACRVGTAPIDLVPWQMLLGGALLAPLAWMAEGPPAFAPSVALAAVLAYTGPVASAACLWAYVTVARSLPAQSTALGSLGIPVSGLLFSAAWLGEPLDLPTVGGLALIGVGVALGSLADLRGSGAAGLR